MDKSATPIPSKYLEGSAVETDATLPMTKQTFKNAGPTTRLRGVEENTAKRDGVWSKIPEPSGITELCVWSVEDAPEFRVREDNA